MTKEELEQLKSTVKQWLFHTGSLDPTNYANELILKFIKPKEKRIEELETTNKKISDECHKLVDSLEKKQNENAELEKACDETQELLDKQIEATCKLDKENAELTEMLEQDCESSWHEGFNCSEKERLKQLTEAKKIIRELSKYVSDSKWYVQNGYVELQKELIAKAEVFINKE